MTSTRAAGFPKPVPDGPSDVPADILEQGISVIIPAFNEEGVIAESIEQVRKALDPLTVPYEIIVVNDGSRDRTGEIASATGVKVINHPANRGYGASLKSGIRGTRFGWIAITD